MSDNTSAGDSLVGGSHSSAKPDAAVGFQSYAEYLVHLDRSPFPPSYPTRFPPFEEQLWLASFTEDGHYIKRYTCFLRDFGMPTDLSSVDMEDIRPDTTVMSSADFRTLLQTTDENVSYRIVIAASYTGLPSRMIEDVLGLGLDLEPEIFDYVKSTSVVARYIPEDEFPLPWFKDTPALRIGSDMLCMLEKTPERKSKTGTREDTPSATRLANYVYSDHILERR